MIDGRTTSALQDAVRDFQVAAGIAPTGAVGPGTPTEKTLIAALPQDLKRLRGVKGLPIAYVEGANTAPSVPFGRLPEEMREAVEQLNAAAEAVLGLPVVLRQGPQQKIGHIAVAVGLGDGIFLDARGRKLPRERTPDAVRDVFKESLKNDPTLSLSPNAPPGQMVLIMQADAEALEDIAVSYFEEQVFHIDVTHLVLEARGYLDEIGITPDMIALAVDDVRLATKVANELGFAGQAYAKKINGRAQIVIKGYAGNRATLTATKYPAAHAKMIAFGVGQLGRTASALKSVVYVGFVVLAADEIVLAMAGEQGYDEAVAGFGIGVAKILTAAAIAEILGLIAAGLAGSTILLPLIVAALASFAVSWALNELDKKYGMTEALKEYVREHRNANWPVDNNPAPPGLPAKAYRPESYLE